MRNINTSLFSQVWGKVSSQGVFYTQIEEPDSSAPLYSGWRVIDPVAAATGETSADKICSAIRIKLPFNEALELVSLAELAKTMPKTPVWATVKATDLAGYSAKVPDLDLEFMPDLRHVAKLLQVLSCRNEPGRGRAYYGFGEAGCGKTSTALWICAVLGLPVEQFNCSEVTEIDDLFVRQIPDNGKWITVDGPLLRALKHRWICLVDEIDLAPPALPPALNDLVEGHQFSVPGYKDETVRAQSGFHLIACGNTGFSGKEVGLYSGRNMLDTSFKSRCVVDRYAPLSADLIAKAIVARYSESMGDVTDIANGLSRFAVDINASMKQEGISDTFSMRSISLFMDTLKDAADTMAEPLVYALVSSLPLMEEDEDFRQTAWNFFVAQLPGMAAKANDFQQIWEHLYDPA